MTAREDEYFGCLFGNSMLSPQARENRQKLANRYTTLPLGLAARPPDSGRLVLPNLITRLTSCNPTGCRTLRRTATKCPFCA